MAVAWAGIRTLMMCRWGWKIESKAILSDADDEIWTADDDDE